MGRALGIDYGEKRVGLALSDKSSLIASPYKTLQYFSENDLISEIKKIVLDKEIEIFVLGLPLNMKGSDSAQTKKVNIRTKNAKKGQKICEGDPLCCEQLQWVSETRGPGTLVATGGFRWHSGRYLVADNVGRKRGLKTSTAG